MNKSSIFPVGSLILIAIMVFLCDHFAIHKTVQYSKQKTVEFVGQVEMVSGDGTGVGGSGGEIEMIGGNGAKIK